jgi:ubiquinol-cytochrome c reductase cytochrome c subunit
MSDGTAGSLRAQRRRAVVVDEVAAVDFTSGIPVTGAEADASIDACADAAARKRAATRRARMRNARRPARRSRQDRLARTRRRLSSGFVLLIALLGMGSLYSLFASSSSAQQSGRPADAANGRALFEISCISCHGANLQGVVGRGPSLIGVGGAAAYFQVATGRMPLAHQGAEAERKPTMYTEDEINDLVAFVQSVAGGPTTPTGSLRDNANMAEGGELFRLNCASCHNFAGKGAPLSAGKIAPGLNNATDLEIYTAMLSGPENMPVFSNNQLTPEQKKAVIAYIQALKESKDPGGHGLGRIGPVSEGIVIWVAGIGLLMGVILWIGAKS